MYSSSRVRHQKWRSLLAKKFYYKFCTFLGCFVLFYIIVELCSMWRWLLLLLRHRKEEPRYSIRFESFMFSQTWCHNTVLGCTLSTDRLINWLGMAIYMEKNVYLYTHKPTQQMHMHVYVRKKFRGTDHIVHTQMIYYYSTDFEFKLDIKSVRNQCANIVFRFH